MIRIGKAPLDTYELSVRNKRVSCIYLIISALFLVGTTSCKQQDERSKSAVHSDKKLQALKEITEYEPKINKIFSDLGLKSVPCPIYFQDTTGIRTDPSDVNTCFTSAQQPEELLPLLSDALKSFSEVSMGWRMDLGTWTTHRKFRSNQQFSITLTAPGLREDTRNDPKVKDVGTIATLFMGYDPQR